MEPMKQQVTKAESIGTVRDGKIVGEYDFYNYLAMFEGKDVRWTLELATTNTLPEEK
jgi:hypothetical protein